jgi:hypothetical protein
VYNRKVCFESGKIATVASAIDDLLAGSIGNIENISRCFLRKYGCSGRRNAHLKAKVFKSCHRPVNDSLHIP